MNAFLKRKKILSQRGFTLIELMIVVAVVAILVALAYPSFLEQIRKTRRADAQAALLQASQTLERCFTRLNAYNASGCPALATVSENGHYTMSYTIAATSYTATATATGGQASDDCGNYTLDHLGNKTPAADYKRCWGSK